MKTIFKIVLVLVLMNGAGRAGLATWNYFQLKDAAQQAVTLGGLDSPEQIQEKISKKAVELRLPVAHDRIVVERDGSRTIAAAAYTESVELFPTYTYPFKFEFKVESVKMVGLK